MRVPPSLAFASLIALLAGRPQQGGAASDLLARLIPAAKAELARLGSDPTDVPAIARSLAGPDDVLRYVREHVSFEPYDGVLRGPAGALAAGAANSFDQALLVQSLLGAMGYASRIVVGEIGEAQRGALVDAFLAEHPRVLATPDQGALARVARQTGLSADRLARLGADLRSRSLGALEEMERAASAHAEALAAAVGAGKGGMRAEAMRCVARHAFAQIAVRNGERIAWRDLDPTPLGNADGTSSVQGAEPAQDLPRHEIEFELIYRAASKEHSILRVTTLPSTALSAPLAFRILPAEDLPARREGEGFADVLPRVKLWQAELVEGGVSHASRVFDLEGGLHDVRGDGRIEAAKGVGNAAARGFQGFGGAFGGGGKKGGPTFESLELRVVFRSPDGAERSLGRRLFDAQDRKAGRSPFLLWEMLSIGGPLGAEFATHRELRHLLPIWELLAESLSGDPPQGAKARVEELAQRTWPANLARLQLARQWRARRLAGTAKARPWQPVPTLLVLERRVKACSEGRVCALQRFDWMSNDLRFLGADDGAAFRAAIEQGAFDTVLEAAVMQRAMPESEVASAAGALQRALDGKKSIAAGDSSGGRRLAVRLGGEDAFYEVDPVFGCSVGRLPEGHGGASAEGPPQAMSEFLKSQKVIVSAMICSGKAVAKAAKKEEGAAKDMILCVLGFAIGMGGYLANFVNASLAAEVIEWGGIAMGAL